MNHLKTNVRKLESNIWKLYLYMILYSLCFYIPIITLFYQSNGLSLTHIMIIQSVASAIFILFEVPSGYFADVHGRKTCLALTGILAASAMLIFAVSTNFYSFLCANILWAFAGVFISGADSAFLFDTLKDLKKESLYSRIWGSTVFYYSIGASFAAIVGSVLGKINYRYPFYAMIPFMLLLIPLSLSLHEPEKHKTIFTKNYLADLVSVLKISIVQNKKLRWLILYSVILLGFIPIAYQLYQPYFTLSGLNVAYFGMVFAGFNAIAALSAKYSYVLEKRLGQNYSLLLLFLLTGASFLFMSHFVSFLSFIFAFFFQFVKGFSSVVISDYVHRLTDSSMRATVLSIKSLMEKTFYAAAAPLIGWIADIYSLQQALTFSGVIVLILGLIITALFWRDKTFVAGS